MSAALLAVSELGVRFERADAAPSRPVDGVSFEIAAGEALGLVGESGCGKSLTALSIVRLLDEPPAATTAGSSIRLGDEQLIGAPPGRLREIRGGSIGFVFQEPMTSLNPVQRIGSQIAETLRAHLGLGRATARERAVALLERTGLPDPARAARSYPHELSGGMRQRALIAIAVACEPHLLIADEPTTALDVTVQARILDLLRSLREETGMALLFISHDLAVVSRVADRVAVMYAGRIVETGPTAEVLSSPRHPYTDGLLRAVPQLHGVRSGLAVIPGRVPSPAAWPAGCRFHPRCPHAWERCATEPPPLADGVRCWLSAEPDRRVASAWATTGRP